MASELLWPVHTFGPRGRSNRTGALLVVNQDAGSAVLAAVGESVGIAARAGGWIWKSRWSARC